jgi:hypothetical protein
MLKSEINPRTDYALREKRAPNAPLQRVRIVEHIRGNKWRAECSSMICFLRDSR